jgi:beta-glucosidase
MHDRTYRYFDAVPLYGFGFGLSYTTFTYSNVRIANTSINAGDSVKVEGDVKNTGEVGGDEVVQLYLTQPKSYETALRELVGFKRLHLGPGESAHVTLTIEPRSLGQVDGKGSRVIVPGHYTVFMGGSQPHEPARAQSATFNIVGKAELPK